MHGIHVPPQGLTGVYSQVQTEKTAANQRSAEVRRALLRAASAAGEDGDGVLAADEDGSGGRQQQEQRQPKRRQDEAPEPFSLWA